MISVLLVGCSSDADKLKKFVDQNRDDIVKKSSTNLLDADIQARGSTFVLSLTFKVEIDEDELDGLDAVVDPQGKVMVESLKEAGLKNPAVLFEVKDMNGKMVWSKEYK
jgi:hypothetical protein